MIADWMAHSTVEALEGVRFVNALRDLLAIGRAVLLPRQVAYPDPGTRELERVIGWEDGNGGAYVIPNVSRFAVERLIGADGLGHLSDHTLYSQLDDLGMLASKGKNTHTRVIKLADGATRRVLHLGSRALEVTATSE
jgi:hypothetical protein